MTPRFFKTPAGFRAWMEKHYATTPKLLVGFHKKASGKPSITWPESVDVALCFGWIDGVRKRIDDVSYTIRFTPRRPRSIWSAINVKRVADLESMALMAPAGRAAFANLDAAKTVVYSYEQIQDAKHDPADEKRLRANRKAWKFFQALSPKRRHLAIWRIISAKRPETRQRRLDALIGTCEDEIYD